MGVLRVFLAINVVIAHSSTLFGFSFVGGLVAVELFFIISGFYMSMILDRKYVGKGSYQLFISNRFLRLFPIYWAVLFLTIIISCWLYDYSVRWNALHQWSTHFQEMPLQAILLQLVTTLALFGQDFIMFIGLDLDSGNLFFTSNFMQTSPQLWRFLFVPQAWTLGLELMFYLIAPFLVRKSLSLILSLIAASFCLRIYIYFYLGYTNDPWTYRFFPTELALFLLGNVSYKLYQALHKRPAFNNRNQWSVLSIFMLILVVYEYIPSLDDAAHFKNWIIYIFATAALPFIFEATKRSRLDNRIGELSYPIYMSHILVILCLTPVLNQIEMFGYMGELSILSTIIFSYLLVILVSDPLEKIRQSRIKSKTLNY